MNKFQQGGQMMVVTSTCEQYYGGAFPISSTILLDMAFVKYKIDGTNINMNSKMLRAVSKVGERHPTGYSKVGK